MSYDSLEGNFEATDTGKNFVSLKTGIGVRNELAIYLIVDPRLRDLIDKYNGSRC